MKTRTSGLRALVALPIVVLLAAFLLAPASALATGSDTSTYGEKPPTPSTGTSPSKEESSPSTTPKEETSPTTTSTTEPAKETAKTLPFTGFDLRWSFAIGLLLIAGGSSIVLMQRRRREDS